jgi:hypothetical protein
MSITVEAVPFLLKFLKEESDRIKKEESSKYGTEVYETIFTDVKTLIKTLKEHGANNIQFDDSYNVTCSVNGAKMEFYKPNNESAYSVKVMCENSSFKIADKEISEITTEYSINVQEASYLHIIDKINENNMHLESETIEEDNTIVLTINLE